MWRKVYVSIEKSKRIVIWDRGGISFVHFLGNTLESLSNIIVMWLTSVKCSSIFFILFIVFFVHVAMPYMCLSCVYLKLRIDLPTSWGGASIKSWWLVRHLQLWTFYRSFGACRHPVHLLDRPAGWHFRFQIELLLLVVVFCILIRVLNSLPYYLYWCVESDQVINVAGRWSTCLREGRHY